MKMLDFNHIFWDRGSMFFPQFLSWTNEYIPIYQYKRSNKLNQSIIICLSFEHANPP